MSLRRPSGSLVVASLALVVAAGGSATAAAMITSAQIKDGTIQAKDISAPAKKSLKGQKGPKGARGPAGPVRLTYVTSEHFDASNPGQKEGHATCPTGQNVISGGVVSSSFNPGEMNVNSSSPYALSPATTPNSWFVYLDVTAAAAGAYFVVYATCTTATSVSPTPQPMRNPKAR